MGKNQGSMLAGIAEKSDELMAHTARETPWPVKKSQKQKQSRETHKAKTLKEADPLGLYFKQISKYPLLTVQEEQTIGEGIVRLRRQIADLETLSVKEGDKVGPGSEIGKLGIDAVSNKPQLFFMVYLSNTPVDPAKAPRA